MADIQGMAVIERPVAHAGESDPHLLADDAMASVTAVPPVLLPYQQRWLADQSPVKVWEKSRRIGASWCQAADSALTAAASRGMNTWYIGYNADMAQEFVRDAAMWSRHYQLAASDVEEEVIRDEDQDILAYRIRYASGWRVTALSSKPRNLRGKQGLVVIDEAAFHPELPELLKAAIALLMWGGRVCVLSTHNGEDNAFHRLVQEIRQGEKPYSLHRTTIDDALADGLYRRICLVQGKAWSPEAEAAWLAELLDLYGPDAEEELRCIPRRPGSLFRREWFRLIDVPPAPLKRVVRYWDRAATEVSRQNPDPDWTSGCKMAIDSLGRYIILDYRRARLGPHGVEQLVKATASEDGYDVEIGLEQDPGQAGKVEAQYLARQLAGYRVTCYPKRIDKLVAARPLASQAAAGNVLMVRAPWNGPVLQQFERFPPSGRGHDDDVDSASGAFGILTGTYTGKRAGRRRARAWGRR
jgi:predicted phage terminase large subunit-like protein